MNNDAAEVKSIKGRRFCWLSGHTASAKPEGWFAPFGLEVAHIASGQGDALRVNDRRAVTVLCSLCHRLHVNHAGGTMTINGVEYPTIDARHTLWIKAQMDPKFYDRSFLAKYWVGTLPDPERPPEFFLDQLAKHQGLLL